MASWSKMKKILEDNMADSLKGRVRYFATRYRKSHDSEGCAGIYIDNNELVRSSYFEWCEQFFLARKNNCEHPMLEATNNKGFDQFSFYEAFYIYSNTNIRECLEHENALVRIFAVFDKRTGKRTLLKIAENLCIEPEWVQKCFKAKLEAENILI